MEALELGERVDRLPAWAQAMFVMTIPLPLQMTNDAAGWIQAHFLAPAIAGEIALSPMTCCDTPATALLEEPPDA